MSGISFYIHIPFCIKKCDYCDFLSGPNFDILPDYMAALLDEIRAFETDEKVRSVFIGGGTPSAVPEKYIDSIMTALRGAAGFDADCEITVESNPGTLTEEKLAAYRAAGINRLSMGVQSFDDRLLSVLGRIHNANDAMSGYSLARKYFDNINLDLMFALPGQSLKDWELTLAKAAELGPEHISAYSLIIEEGTPFYGRFDYADEETDRRMYYFAKRFLAENGYKQYEISNFAKAGRECRHNLVYWQGGDYKGFGLGAASLLNNARTKNTEVMREYLGGVTVCETDELDTAERMNEFVMLGLRCTDGISAQVFKTRFGMDIFEKFGDIFEKHKKTGLLSVNGDNIRLTEKGTDLSNMVFVDLV